MARPSTQPPIAPNWAFEEPAYALPVLASMWGMSRGDLAKRCARGEFPGAFKVGRDWRVPASVANRWRQERTPFPAVSSGA